MSTRFPEITDDQWRTFVADIAEALELREGDRVFEVQCGTAAFLLPLYEAGCVVGGIDSDARLVAVAREHMPDGEWAVGDMHGLNGSDKWDVVVACGALDLLSTLHDAGTLLEVMTRKATSAVAVLDVPSGLPFDERWFLRSLSALGATSLRLPDPRIEGYAPGQPRFNVIARLG